MKNVVHIGLPIFHVSLACEGGKHQLGVGAVYGGRYRNFPGGFHSAELVGGADGALAALVAGFGSLCGPFAGNGDEAAVFDLGALAGQPDLLLERKGLFISLKGHDGACIEFGSESVLPLEILAALGNELAEISDDPRLKEGWAAILDRFELLPMSADDWFADPGDDASAMNEARWYADRLGQDIGRYVDTARWLRARQTLFATKMLEAEPTAEEYDCRAMPALPPSPEIDELAARAAAAISEKPEVFLRDAVAERNHMARQEVVFRRWYGSMRQDSTTSS
jgi:hypothetical protein